jgi:hypothetical protein
LERSGAGVDGGALNNNVEAELRALQQTAAEKNCPVNTSKPELGPIYCPASPFLPHEGVERALEAARRTPWSAHR